MLGGLDVPRLNLRTLAASQAKVRDIISVKEPAFGAKGNRVNDDTAAIQAAVDYCGRISHGSIISAWDDPVNLKGAIAYLPPGRYKCDLATLEMTEGVGLRGAGSHSSIIESAYDGYILRNETSPNYTAFGISLEDFSIVGDRTKVNQVGLSLLRTFDTSVRNVTVQRCGNDGIRILQGLDIMLNTVESLMNVGNGLLVRDGINSWTDTASSGWPTNNIMVLNGQFCFNDAAGIRCSGIVYGALFKGGACEYNYRNSGDNVGYNIEITSASIVPIEFEEMWVEGPVQAHVYQNCTDVSDAVRLTRLRHFSNGPAGNVDRAVIVDKGSMYIDYAYGHGASYKSIAGSVKPFRVKKAGGEAVIWTTGCQGSTITDGLFVEDETGAVASLYNQTRQNNHGTVYGHSRHINQFGQNGPFFRQDNQTFDWLEVSNFYSGFQFGDGTAAVDTNFQRVGAGQMAVKNATGAGLTLKMATVLKTAVAGATVTCASLIPDGAFLIGVTTLVTAGLGVTGGTTGYAVGDVADPNRWGDVVGTIAGTDSDNTDATANPTGAYTAAGDVVLTAAGGNFDGTGAIRVTAMYLDVIAPTS